MTFGENLRILRNSHALSQKDLAEELGFSFQNISKWERNDSLPDIETLLSIAKFFGTTTDALLGHMPDATYAVLKIDAQEIRICQEYPVDELRVTGKLVLSVDRAGKIAAIVYILPWRNYQEGYIRGEYDPFGDSGSTIIYEHPYRMYREEHVEIKKIHIPEGGYLLFINTADYAAKKILNFIIPDEYGAYLNPDTHPNFTNRENGLQLFSDILKHNELDLVTIERTDNCLLFKKPTETVNPMSVNIETLAKIVRKELEKEHNKQIEELKLRVDELLDLVEDIEDFIQELDSRVDNLESQLHHQEDETEN